MRAILLFLTALLLASPATAAAPDWTKTVTQTPQGTFVLGNPKATRLVEYVSYTCPHCAHFMAEAAGPLRTDWVKKGALSLEVRHAIRDPYDLTAAVLARCGGAARFFGDHEALFAHYDDWMEQVQGFEAKRTSLPPAKSIGGQLAQIATGTGLSDFMAKRGLPLARQNACFADDKSVKQVAAMAKEAWEERKIGGTPAFMIGDKLVDDAHDWDALRPALPAPRK